MVSNQGSNQQVRITEPRDKGVLEEEGNSANTLQMEAFHKMFQKLCDRDHEREEELRKVRETLQELRNDRRRSPEREVRRPEGQGRQDEERNRCQRYQDYNHYEPVIPPKLKPPTYTTSRIQNKISKAQERERSDEDLKAAWQHLEKVFEEARRRDERTPVARTKVEEEDSDIKVDFKVIEIPSEVKGDDTSEEESASLKEIIEDEPSKFIQKEVLVLEEIEADKFNNLIQESVGLDHNELIESEPETKETVVEFVPDIPPEDQLPVMIVFYVQPVVKEVEESYFLEVEDSIASNLSIFVIFSSFQDLQVFSPRQKLILTFYGVTLSRFLRIVFDPGG